MSADTVATTAAAGRAPRLDLDVITPNNVGQLRCLNSALFPVHYPESFYTEAANNNPLCQLGYFNQVCVAAVCCRREPIPNEGRKQRVYLMTLGVLAPYRGYGLGTKLLDYALDQCSKDASIAEIYLHVQDGNDEALSFYQKRGFTIRETVPDYYTNIKPSAAHVLVKCTAS
ncbi:Nat13 protein [Thamnocephalis sphaerospora]|uniref:Nat13 protein n=1 Tax=Thamnocephalis sphaerospora TaxID=78915 RepID=A0A4P9XXF9_9FUNG|nr:Nat13 protein [Thamnocephalis sphaerospora]|eukprot:RKP11065.1 Nat13 protein [Thamnocephalis sphaerospora]